MACRLNRTLLTCITLLVAAMPLHTLAQALPDPTRPQGSTLELGSAGQTVASGLQSIIRRQGQKPQALIHGELVALGGKVGESRLIAINDDSVVLRAADGSRETLTLTPGISKARPTSHMSK